MSVTNPRTKIVNFRLSEGEFEKLKSACEANGARSVSDFARAAVLRSIDPHADGDQQASSRDLVVDRKIADIETRIDQLIQLFGATGSELTNFMAAVPMAGTNDFHSVTS